MVALTALAQQAIYSLIPSAAQDVIGVYDQVNYQQVFANARPIKAMIKRGSKLMDQPVETGTEITDQTIILPVEIELSMIITSILYRNVYQVIKQLFLSRTFLTVQTQADIFNNQIISEMPHEEGPDQFGSIVIALKMREIQLFTAITQPWNPKNKNSSSTVSRGNIQTKPVDAPKRTALNKLLGLGG